MTETQKIDCLFINPRDLIGADAYIKLANLAGMLETKNISSRIIEPAASHISHEEIMDMIKLQEPSIICIAAFPSTLHDAYITCNLVKERFPEKIIILEGYHINADPSIILHMGIPYGIRGDAEYSFLEFCENILAGQAPSQDLSGLVINNKGELKANEPAFVRDMDALPMPAYHKLPIGNYYSASTNKTYMKFFTTRGCPYDCNFCASAPQMKYRQMSNENVVKHLDVLVNKLGVQWIEFMDLTFTVSKRRTMEMCDAIIESGLVFDWGCETRADKIDEDLIIKMKSAGCKKITFGVESGNEKIRQQTGKRISNEAFKTAFNLCRKHKLKTMANFILGHPGETAEDMKETIRFARELKPFNVLFLRMIPLPDVEVYAQGVKNGEVPADIWLQYMRGEIDHPVYYPSSIDPKEMDRLFSLAYVRFYISMFAIRNYLPFIFDFNFMKKSLSIFFRLAFGKPVFK
jgi:anaerobic magnesium-protoporphyrin IX monomethyl ester cyclase